MCTFHLIFVIFTVILSTQFSTPLRAVLNHTHRNAMRKRNYSMRQRPTAIDIAATHFLSFSFFFTSSLKEKKILLFSVFFSFSCTFSATDFGLDVVKHPATFSIFFSVLLFGCRFCLHWRGSRIHRTRKNSSHFLLGHNTEIRVFFCSFRHKEKNLTSTQRRGEATKEPILIWQILENFPLQLSGITFVLYK